MAFFLLILVCALLITVIYMSSLSGSFEVSASKVIQAHQDELFDKVVDLRTWADWSPWLMHEPDCPLEFTENPNAVEGGYSWEGKLIGAGTLTHKQIDRPIYIEAALSLTRPFKSDSKVTFDFREVEGGTLIRWTMSGGMPLFFRPMIPRVKEMVAQEYELGLAQLGGLMVPSSDHPEIEFIGEQNREQTTYISIPWKGPVEDLPAAKKAGYTKLREYIASNDIKVLGQPFAVYHEVKKRATYFVVDLAFPVAEGTTDDKYQVKTLKGGKFHQTQLKGGYQYLKATWHSSINNVKMHKIKMDWNRPCVELYENDPRTAEHNNNIVTSLFVPIK
jgi:effector-binding domain-containing protein